MKHYIVEYKLPNNFRVHVVVSNQTNKDNATMLADKMIGAFQRNCQPNVVTNQVKQINQKTEKNIEIWNIEQERFYQGTKKFFMVLQDGRQGVIQAGGIKSAYINIHKQLKRTGLDRLNTTVIIIDLNQPIKAAVNKPWLVAFRRDRDRVYVALPQNAVNTEQEAKVKAESMIKEVINSNEVHETRDSEGYLWGTELTNPHADELKGFKAEAVERVTAASYHHFSNRIYDLRIFWGLKETENSEFRNNDYRALSYLEQMKSGSYRKINEDTIEGLIRLLDGWESKPLGGLIILLSINSKGEEELKLKEKQEAEAKRLREEVEKQHRREEKQRKFEERQHEIEEEHRRRLAEIEREREEQERQLQEENKKWKEERNRWWAELQHKREERERQLQEEIKKREEQERLERERQEQEYKEFCSRVKEEERKRREAEQRRIQAERRRIQVEQQKLREEEQRWIAKGRSLNSLRRVRKIKAGINSGKVKLKEIKNSDNMHWLFQWL